MGDFITQSSTLPLLYQIANSVILCSTKWYLGVHWGLRWKRNYPQIKTGKKPSEKLHFDVECNPQSSMFLFSVQFANTVFWKSAMGFFRMQWSLRWQRKYAQMKTRRKISLKLLGDVWIRLTELHWCFLQQFIITLCEEPERTSLDRIEACADKGNIVSSKRAKSFLGNVFVICEFHWQSYSWVLRKHFANTLLVESANEIWEPIGAYGEKGNILSSKLERSLLKNCTSTCECNSQSYTFLFSLQFANTVFW